MLDTWFSSWLWPLSTLGWPEKTKDLAYFYPTNTLVTAQEIIFFWVARMIMAGCFCMKRPPFTDVYIHGTVRDITGKKMSKSLGNIIDPLDIIKQYGTDALRYTLVTATAIGQDVFLSEERFVAGRNFANKLWNATRYVLSQEVTPHTSQVTKKDWSVPDRWILSRLQQTVDKVARALEQLLFNEATTTIYDFLWHDYCDWYLEISKIKDQASQGVLVHVLETALRLLHPMMPFVTEELWQHLQTVGAQGSGAVAPNPEPRTPNRPASSSIMTAPWPKAEKKLVDAEAERLFERLQGVVAAIRNTRAELNIPLDSRPAVRLAASQDAVRSFFETHRPLLQALAALGTVDVGATREHAKDAAAMVVDGVEILMPLVGLIDAGKERARLQQRVEELTKQLAGIEGRLKDDQFTSKAPKEVVEQTQERRAQVRELLKKFSDHLSLLQSM